MKKIGYWVSSNGFEGGIRVPENFQSSEIYFMIKKILPASVPLGIRDEEGFRRKCSTSLEYEDNLSKKMKERLSDYRWWDLDELRENVLERRGGGSMEGAAGSSHPSSKST